MDRITIKTLRQDAEMLNRMTDSALEYSAVDSAGKRTSNVGHFHISQQYGGYALHRTMNDGGGINCIFNRGHMPARALHDLITAYRYGLEAQK